MNRLLYTSKTTRLKTSSVKRQIRGSYTASKGTSIDSFFFIRVLCILFLATLSFIKSGCSDTVYCMDYTFMDETLEMSNLPPAVLIRRMNQLHIVRNSPFRQFIPANNAINRALHTHLRRADQAYVAAQRAAFGAHRVNFRQSLELTVRQAYFRFRSAFTMQYYERLRVDEWRREIDRTQHAIRLRAVLRRLQRKLIEKKVGVHKSNFKPVFKELHRKALERTHKRKLNPVLKQLVQTVPRTPASVETEISNNPWYQEEDWESDLRNLTNNPSDFYTPSNEFLEFIKPYI